MKTQKEEKVVIELEKSSLKFFFIGVGIAGILFIIYLWFTGGLPKISTISEKISYFFQTANRTSPCNTEESIKKVKPSVVKIVVDDGVGSGFIVSKDGFIVTNYHVVQNETEAHVIFSNGSSDLAKVYNYDPKVDIAILKTAPQNDLQPLEWGDPSMINSGTEVVAIGFPYGNVLKGEATVTKGGLSATRESDDGLIKYIQTDTSLNHGNSGGPLIDSCGKVIGINEIAISETDGLNFAISAVTAKTYIETLTKEEKSPTQLAGETTLTPTETVEWFYALISTRRLEEAFSIFSPAYQATVNIDHWRSGYSTSLNTYTIDIHPVTSDKSGYEAVSVNLASADLVNDKVVFREFKGVWYLIQTNGRWGMDHSLIREIK